MFSRYRHTTCGTPYLPASPETEASYRDLLAMNTQRHESADRRIRTLTALFGLMAFLGLSVGMTAHAQEKDKKEAVQPAKPALEAGKDAKDAKHDGPQYRLRNAVRLGY